MPPLERSPITQPCSSVSWEQNGYYAAQDFLRVSDENVRRIQESFDRRPRKSTRRSSRELGIPQPTLWRVLRHCLLLSLVHLFESPRILMIHNGMAPWNLQPIKHVLSTNTRTWRLRYWNVMPIYSLIDNIHNVSSFNVNSGIPLDNNFDCTVTTLF